MTPNSMHCERCGRAIAQSPPGCAFCIAELGECAATGAVYRNKAVAGVLAILLGSFGVHHFYLGQWRGLAYLAFYWTWIPMFLGVFEGVVFLTQDEASWRKDHGSAEFARKHPGAIIYVVAIIAAIFLLPIGAALYFIAALYFGAGAGRW